MKFWHLKALADPIRYIIDSISEGEYSGTGNTSIQIWNLSIASMTMPWNGRWMQLWMKTMARLP